MRVSDQFVTLLEGFEGFKPCPYKDQGGVPTIGIGTTSYPTGVKVRMVDICVSHDTATTYLKSFVAGMETEIEDWLPRLTQNQYDAIMSFTYNVGTGALKDSTLLRKMKVDPNDPSIREEFMKWINVNHKPDAGLKSRRTKEANLYFK